MADGLNLVVKEGATLNNRNGVIVSTESVGAISELREFCVIADSSNEANIVKALEAAGKLSAKNRRIMAQQLKAQVSEFDASFWAQSVVASFKILEKV